MLKDQDPDFVREITNGDVAVCNQLAKDPSLLLKLKHWVMALGRTKNIKPSSDVLS